MGERGIAEFLDELAGNTFDYLVYIHIDKILFEKIIKAILVTI